MRENEHPKMPAALFGKKGSRRDFLRNTAVTALAGSALAACSIDDSGGQTVKVNDADHSGGTMAPNPAPVSAAAAARQSYTYEFTAPNPGSHMYHSHHKATTQGHGMFGMVTALTVK